MDYSVQLHNDNVSWQALKQIALAVDRGRWRTLWNYDHLVPPMAEMLPHLANGDLRSYEEGPVLEAQTMVAAFAALTERVRLGTLVNAMPFRNPALLAKMAATIDHVSNGRLELGLGAAWHAGEARAYGIDLGADNKTKFGRFEEGLEVLRLLLTPGPARRNFRGEHYTLDDAPFAPAPVQSRIPVLIGGGGEKKTLPLVARYADSYNFFASLLSTPELFEHKNRLLDQYARDAGRDPRAIRRTVAVFADLEDNDARARERRQGLGGHLDEAAQNQILFGTAQFILDGVGQLLEQVQVDEVIFCGLKATPDAYQRFDEEVLARLTRTPALV